MQVTENIIGAHKEVCFTDKKTGFKTGILTSYGANLNRFEIPFNGASFNLIKGYNSPADFIKNYNGVILAPFPGRIKNGQYSFEGNNYQLPINQTVENNAQHGFLYNKSFVVEASTVNGGKASIILSHNYDGKSKGYPFPFKCLVHYVWDGAALKVSITIINKGDTNMPLGLGWHPYFRFPCLVNDLELELNCKHQYKLDEKKIPTNETVAFDRFQKSNLVQNTFLDNCFALPGNELVQTIIKDNKNGIRLIMEQATGVNQFNYIQIYTPKDRQSIALEPMTCTPDAFNNKNGLITLKPKEETSVAYTLRVDINNTNL